MARSNAAKINQYAMRMHGEIAMRHVSDLSRGQSFILDRAGLAVVYALKDP
jgi:hypothetical protein